MKLTEIQSHIYIVAHSGKMHLDPNCKYLRNLEDSEYRRRPSDNYPESHVDLCSWCETYHADWKEGISITPSEKECDRCGKKDVQRQYCDDCVQQIALRR